MDRMRDSFVAEIDRLQVAISKTKSQHLRRDYSKAVRRMKAELRDYDRFKGGESNG
jgi:hypothetical protein